MTSDAPESSHREKKKVTTHAIDINGRAVRVLFPGITFRTDQSLTQLTHTNPPNSTSNMHFTSLFLATLGAVSASALPSGQSSPCNAASPGNTFGLVAIRSGSPVQYAGFNAALSSLFAGLPSQNASCDCTDTGYATFYLNNGGLFLYAESATPQQFFVDRSGMGMFCRPPFPSRN